MKRVINRATNFLNRLKILTRAIGLFHALHILMEVKQHSDVLHVLTYKGHQVHFRKSDLQAILEVLGNQEYAFLLSEIDGKGPILILDIGGHIGTFAIWALCINPEAHMISIEPDPETFAILKQNAEGLRSKAFRWDVIQAAAARQNGALLRFSTSGPSMSHRIDPDGTIEVEGISLDTLLKLPSVRAKSIHVIKVDAEGAEVEFITSRPELLRRVRCIAVELHPYLTSPDGLESVLRAEYSDITTHYGNHSNKPLLMAKRGND